jgi:hypothetical protein
MLKKVLAVLICAVCVFSLSACTKANDLNLSFTEDGTDSLDIIHIFGEEQFVYVSGGIMMIEIDKTPKTLELAFHDGDVSVDDILLTAEQDVEDGDIKTEEYPDGSVEYYYESFTLVRLNTVKGDRNIYFLPTTKGYYDVAK